MTIAAGSVAGIAGLKDLQKFAEASTTTERMPTLFVGHGSPMNAIEDNRFTKEWERIGRELPRPGAILVISAHWLTQGVRVTAMEHPRTIHDFGGFPQDLFDVEYPAPGSPEVAKAAQAAIASKHVKLDDEWGIDHGSWSVLYKMYPKADIPVLQLSLDYNMPMAEHLVLAKELRILREKGVLVLASGNVVHNLRQIDWRGNSKFDWAIEFDEWVRKMVEDENPSAIADFQSKGALAKLAHPTYDHFLPLLYTVGLREKGDKLDFFNEGIEMGSISMRSILLQ